MNEKKDQMIADAGTIEGAARLAAEQAQEANAQPDHGSYTHKFKTPFSYEGETYEELTFQWDGLTGKDSLDIERELRTRGITVVVAEYTPEYLAAMAAKACTYRDSEGKRKVSAFTLQAMPLRDYRAICANARRFLQRAES